MWAEPMYKRVVLKLSGEALAGDMGYGIDQAMLAHVAEQVQDVRDLGIDVLVVVGGGNIWRGIAGSKQGLERATADYMGMLATVMNSLALQSALESIGIDTRVQSAIEMRQIAEPYIRRKAIRHLEKGRVVIFAADTTAALRAAELDAEVILMAKKVDGVYSADPKTDPAAVKFDTLSFKEVLEKELKVMDSTAASLCKDNRIPIVVFNINEKGNARKAVLGENVGTVVGGEICD